MSTFRVVGPGDQTIFTTDDWVEACWASLTTNWPVHVGYREYRGVRGTHPTHDWDEEKSLTFLGQEAPRRASRTRRCRKCHAWDNGSYGSQAPCGYDWSHDSLFSALARERAAAETKG